MSIATTIPEHEPPTLLRVEDALDTIIHLTEALYMAAHGLQIRDHVSAMTALTGVVQDHVTHVRDMVAELRAPEGADELEDAE